MHQGTESSLPLPPNVALSQQLRCASLSSPVRKESVLSPHRLPVLIAFGSLVLFSCRLVYLLTTSPHLFSPTVGSFNLLGLERGSNPNFFSFRVSRALTLGGRSIRFRPGHPLRGLQQTLDWRTRRHRGRYIHILFAPTSHDGIERELCESDGGCAVCAQVRGEQWSAEPIDTGMVCVVGGVDAVYGVGAL